MSTTEEILERYTTYEPSTGEWTIYDNRGEIVKTTLSRAAAEAMAEAMYNEYVRSTR